MMEVYDLIKEIPSPYSYNLFRSGLFKNDYQIIYEGDVIKYVSGTHQDIIDLIKLMNSSYMIGALDQIGRMQSVDLLKKED